MGRRILFTIFAVGCLGVGPVCQIQAQGPGGLGQSTTGVIQNDGQIEGAEQGSGFIGAGAMVDPRAASFSGNTGGMGGMGGMGMGGMGMGMGMGGMGGFGRMGGFGNMNQNNQTQNTLRFPYVISFKTQPLIVANVQARAELRLTKLPGLSKYNRVAVVMDGTSATLRGDVVSERDKRFVEKLVLLEPGIEDVTNELAVQPPAEK
ncbi:MAG: hypothetical protein VX738_02995 [Planctomycetota bacterium]|nr:hypothetical protein [Planctomycetota bacterium]